MPYYEVLCLASGKLGRSELGEVLRKACRAFMDSGGIVTRISPLGANGHGPRDIAYRIRINQVSHHTAFFVNICAFASPQALAEVNRQLGIDERVLRHLSLRKSLRDAVEPIQDVDAVPPSEGHADPNDPDYILQKFLKDYEREFPKGTTYHAGDADAKKAADGSSGGKWDSGDEVNKVLANLRASSQTAKRPGGDRGLAWLSDLKKDPSDPPR